ncbi:right-handed parallel beta-helix repeat-containing protein [Candidatus Bathyarchaeota archaeon]|nr:right-handed parallel beta-helix repeat-containing protein [Candidatus Bathyarchaeota archaeon]
MKKTLTVAMVLILLSSTMIMFPIKPANANSSVIRTLFDQDVAWAHVKVEEYVDSVKWTIDLDENSAYLNNPVAGIVVVIGLGNEIKFQIHNNDGIDPHYSYGTWLISYYDGGWRTGSPYYLNYPLPDGITATGGRSKSENPQMAFTVTIAKSYLANEFKWAVYFKGGSGGRTFYPPEFSWYDTDTSDMATAKYLILGGAVAPLAKAMGTNEQFYWGSGCWAAVLGQKFEIYIDPTLPPFNALGGFTIDDIASISYHTNTPHPITGTTPHNFYVVIYTKPDGINDHGWYGYKLIGEPYLSNNLNAPANQWNKWSTDAGTNQLTFFDPDTIGFYGFYGQPTLQNIQAGPINWHDYYSGCPVTNIDYGVEIVKYISFQTATGWMNIFQGYIDAITIALKDGTTVSVDLEGFASEVWVDDDWANLPPGYEVEPGKFIGYNAFAKIQDGINAVTSGGIVHVYSGEYIEQIIINKNLSLEGTSGAKILAPDTRSTFTIPESGATFDPIIFAYGSLSGDETISVAIEGFEIDGGNKAVSNYRYVGILCRNIKPGTISNNVIHNMYPPSGKGSGPQTFGILVYGNSEAAIQHNVVQDFSRGGIGVLGDAGLKVDPNALVKENTVYGNGFEQETGWWAENGIQIGYGATAHVVGNEVFNCTVNNPYWAATGILVVDTSDVVVENNYVEGCDIGIGAVDFPGSIYGSPWDYHTLSNVLIKGNTLIGNTWQVDISNDAKNVTLICNNILNAKEDGIDVWSYEGAGVAPTDIKINYNNIVGSGSYGLWVGDDVEETVDARYNWWGDPTGPYHPTLNPTGLGDNVSGNANFEPWLLTEKVPPLVHDIAIVKVVPSAIRVASGTTIQVDVTVKNEGNTYETFDVSLYYNGNLIAIETIIDMVPGSTTLLTFNWDTSGVPYGTYTLKAEASIVPGETDTADNVFVDGLVRIGPEPTIKVEPLLFQAQLLNKTFHVNVTINGLWEGWRAVAVQFRLCYNETLLKVVDVTEGPFMKDPRWNKHGTFFIWFDQPNDPFYGSHVIVGILLLPNPSTGIWETFPSGDGVLATITFKTIYQERGLEKPPLTCELKLVDVMVIDDDLEEIPLIIEHGLYEMYPTHIGDINYDGKVDMKDVAMVSKAFGSYEGYGPWNPICDVNGDGKVDIKDVAIVSKGFGWTKIYDP